MHAHIYIPSQPSLASPHTNTLSKINTPLFYAYDEIIYSPCRGLPRERDSFARFAHIPADFISNIRSGTSIFCVGRYFSAYLTFILRMVYQFSCFRSTALQATPYPSSRVRDGMIRCSVASKSGKTHSFIVEYIVEYID